MGTEKIAHLFFNIIAMGMEKNVLKYFLGFLSTQTYRNKLIYEKIT